MSETSFEELVVVGWLEALAMSTDPERLRRVMKLTGLEESAFAVLWTQSPAFHRAATVIGDLLDVIEQSERATSVGPPAPPRPGTPDAGWYNLLVGVNTRLRRVVEQYGA